MKLRGVLLAFFLLCVSSALVCEAAESGSDKEKLRGLKEVGVFVELVKPPSESQGLNRNQLQGEVEAKLRQAGITVVTNTGVEALPNLPFIYLNLTISKLESMYAYSADFFCLTAGQGQQAAGNPAAWNVGSSGLAADLVQVREKVAELLNLFIKDYVAVNPGARMGLLSRSRQVMGG